MQSDMCYIGEMVRKLCERQEILGSISDECKKNFTSRNPLVLVVATGAKFSDL